MIVDDLRQVLLDTGPLVAWPNRRDAHRDWARETIDALAPPLLTCEAVLSEACFLVRRLAGGEEAVPGQLERTLTEAFRRLVLEGATAGGASASFRACSRGVTGAGSASTPGTRSMRHG